MSKKGGLADSPFFRMPSESVSPSSVAIHELPPTPVSSKKQKSVKRKSKKKKDKVDTVIPRHHDTKHDTMQPRNHDTMVETIRQAVKEFGKEAATHRFTVEEKKALSDIVYSYKGRGIKSSENEVTRIAINFLIADYKENGENSILHQAIEALNS